MAIRVASLLRPVDGERVNCIGDQGGKTAGNDSPASQRPPWHDRRTTRSTDERDSDDLTRAVDGCEGCHLAGQTFMAPTDHSQAARHIRASRGEREATTRQPPSALRGTIVVRPARLTSVAAMTWIELWAAARGATWPGSRSWPPRTIAKLLDSSEPAVANGRQRLASLPATSVARSLYDQLDRRA